MMSLISFWSGNFLQTRKNLGNSCFELLKFHTRSIRGISIIDASRLTCRISPAIVEGALQKQSVFNPQKSALQDFRHFNPQQTVFGHGIFDRPCTFIALDIETSGFSPKSGNIIEIAARDLFGGKNSTIETLVNPDKPILNSHVHGISTHMVNNPGIPRFEEFIPIFLQFVRSRQIEGKPVAWVAHNGRRFDVPFIIKEFQRCSTEIPSDWVFIDTLPLARQLVMPDGSKLASSSLKALSKHYKIPLVGQAHRAMQDVMTLCSIFQRITFDLKLTAQELLDTGFRASDLTKVPR